VLLIHAFSLFWKETDLIINIGQTLVTGLACGAIGITVAHELIHRKDKTSRAIGVYLLASVNYTWFRIAHVFGHHKHVATPLDPSTSNLNESLYPFLIRSTCFQ